MVLILAPAALASTTWYVDGVNGNDSNDCLASQTACKTIGHAISLCSSGDSIMVAPATYYENLTISTNLQIIGSGVAKTIVDGNQAGTVVTISSSTAVVALSKLTIRNGSTSQGGNGGGINNSGTLTIDNSTISGNYAGIWGGGLVSSGGLTINNSTISNNNGYYGGGMAVASGGATINKSTVTANRAAYGGAIADLFGYLAIKNSTLTSNQAGQGGGVYNSSGNTTITNSTISGNTASAFGGGIAGYGRMTINSSTISKNSGTYGTYGDSIFVDNYWGGESVTLQNTVVASSGSGANCSIFEGGTITSNGYNLSSDDTCNFTGAGDMNNTDPKLRQLGDNGGPTQTIRLRSRSPAIDAGNPNGCTDDKGNLLKTDQRGWRRPGRSDTGGCDIGAFERQKD